MTVFLTSDARLDLIEAAEYYESQDEGLGLRFRDEIGELLRIIAGAPFLWRERPSGYRRVNCPVFPFYLAYVVRSERIVVVAVANAHRKPGFWHQRLED
jgi:hypothetical protein